MSRASAGPASRPAAARKPRSTGKAAAARPGSRFGRLGPWGMAAVLGVGVVVLTPFLHAFFGDVGVLVLGLVLIGFLLGRWTAPLR